MNAVKKKFWTPRLAALSWFLLMVVFYGQGLGSVMRESDQASLLEGAFLLAKNGQGGSVPFYNYANQWLSYWLLSVPIRVALGAGEGFDLGHLVYLGNAVAMVLALCGLGAAYVFGAGRSWTATLAGALLMLVPTWIFSVPLLSSNVLSLGFLGLWVVAMERLRGAWRLILSALLAFMAVGCRADAVLVFPALALAWWGVGKSWLEAWRAWPLWSSALAALAALLVGRFLAGGGGSSYEAFFQAKTFLAYLCFGLGGALAFYGGLLWLALAGVFRKKDKGEAWRCLLWVCLLFLPLLFYGRLLFTPRHLMTSFSVLFLSLCLAGAQPWWQELVRGRGRWIFCVGAVALVLPMFFGIRLSSLKSGKFVFSGEATQFPSADGLWSMGRYAEFMGDLGASEARPIDHNQRIWGAWQRLLPEENWRGEKLFFRSAGLSSYGTLWATWHDLSYFREDEGENTDGAVVLGDDRSLMKQAISVNGDLTGDAVGKNGESGRVLSEFHLGRILQFGSPSAVAVDEARDLLATTSFLREKYGGDAFLLAGYDGVKQVAGDARFRWGVVKRGKAPTSESAMAINANLWYEELLGDATEVRDDKFLFLVRSELPRCFSLSLFRKR